MSAHLYDEFLPGETRYPEDVIENPRAAFDWPEDADISAPLFPELEDPEPEDEAYSYMEDMRFW